MGDDGGARTAVAGSVRHRLEQALGELGVDQRVMKHARRGQPADPTEDACGGILEQRLGRRAGAVGQRQRIDLGIAVGVLAAHRKQVCHGVLVGHRDDLVDDHRLEAPRLATEPAPGLQVARQDHLEAAPRGPGQQLVPGARHLQLRHVARLPCDRAAQHPHRLHREPVEGVRAESKEIGLVADRWKVAPAEHLDRLLPLEGGEVEIRVLHEAGEVGQHQDRLALVCRSAPRVAPDEGQDLAVLGVEELERAATEGRVLLAQLDEPPGPAQQ